MSHKIITTLAVSLSILGGVFTQYAIANNDKSPVSIKSHASANIMVLQTDFGLLDTAVASMRGVAYQVSPNLVVADATHDIPAYSIWSATYRLKQTVNYWPKGTVFVSVVDPGVGTKRHSVVAKLKTGHYIVTPDNGTLTLLDDEFGIEEVRIIDEKTNRLAGSDKSYTFHGRDVYVYTGARLASGAISFEQVGSVKEIPIVKLPYQPAKISNGVISGNIDILDPNYGNIWTNIKNSLIEQAGFKLGDELKVVINHNNADVYQNTIKYVHTFGDVAEGQPLIYLNSSLELAIALNMGNFAHHHNIEYGEGWKITISKKEQ